MHAVSKTNKAVSMKIAIEDSKRCNIPAKREKLKTVNQRKEVDEVKRKPLYKKHSSTLTLAVKWSNI